MNSAVLVQIAAIISISVECRLWEKFQKIYCRLFILFANCFVKVCDFGVCILLIVINKNTMLGKVEVMTLSSVSIFEYLNFGGYGLKPTGKWLVGLTIDI